MPSLRRTRRTFCQNLLRRRFRVGCLLFAVPIVVAGGNKVSALQALTMTHRAMQAGAAGMDMGRNIFQAESPAAMIEAVRAVVHGGETPKKAHELYESLKNSAPAQQLSI